MSKTILKEEEIVAFELRALYKKYGYLPYKMSKFEEYDLYARNKEFLEGARIVTFNDTDGKLLALKPDITLSIVKNDTDSGAKRKVFYNENVYRASKRTGGFKELQQIGLECLGDIDLYDVYETVYLAAASLRAISEKFVLDISHLGILTALLNEVGAGKDFTKQALEYIAEKNVHELKRICEEAGVEAKKLTILIGAYGSPSVALAKLETVCEGAEAKKALDDLKLLCKMLSKTELKDNIRLDFSVVGNGNYYDSVVFNGFVEGISERVLSGGRYDRLLARMGKKSGAIGFAVYLDLLEELQTTERTEDVDVLVLYGDGTPAETVARTVQKLVNEGYAVSAQKQKGNLRCKKLVDITGGEEC